MLFAKKPTVGLDLGTYSVKCCSSGKKGLEAMWQGLLMDARDNRDDTLAKDALVGRVSQLASEHKLSGKVNAIIPGQGTIARYLEFPQLSPKELAVAGPAEAQSHVPWPMPKTNISFLQVPPLKTGEKKSALFFVADQRERVDDGHAVLTRCGLKVNRMEVPVLALTREFMANHPNQGDEVVLLVHCGFTLTHVLGLRGRHPYYYREVKLAGRDFTYNVQQSRQCSWAEAEKFKLGYDVIARQEMVEPTLQRWLQDLKRTLGAFEKESGLKVSRIFLSGGCAPWTNLTGRLGEHLERPVELDSWNQLHSSESPSLYKVAAGLALEESA